MDMNHIKTVTGYLPDEAATQTLGTILAQHLDAGLTIYLEGHLGAGKTTLTRALIHALGYQGKVKSPTYALVENYDFDQFTIYHFDLYRFADPEEWEDAGFRDYFSNHTVCLVEWPDKAEGLLPTPDLCIQLKVEASGRYFSISAFSEHGLSCLIRISTQLDAA